MLAILGKTIIIDNRISTMNSIHKSYEGGEKVKWWSGVNND